MLCRRKRISSAKWERERERQIESERENDRASQNGT